MKLNARQEQWVVDWFHETFYQWGGPCGDDSHFEMDANDVDQINITYYNDIAKDDKLFQEEWKETIEDFIKDFKARFGKDIEKDDSKHILLVQLGIFLDA